MSTPAQAPVYLDENGNPKGAATPAAPAPQPSTPAAPQGGSVYLDDQGNPKGAAAGPPPAPKGPTIGPQPKTSDVHMEDLPSFGIPGAQLTMPLVKGLVDLHDKLKGMESFTQEGRAEHPIQAHIGDLANRIEGLLIGNEQHPEAGIGTGQSGLLNNPVTGSLIPGAEGEPALAAGLRGGASAIKSGVQAAKELVTGGKVAEETPGLIKQAIQGKNIAQEPAKAAIRAATGAEEDAALLEGNRTIVDDRINSLAQKEKAAYKALDDKAGFDVKEAKIRLKNDQYKIKQLGNTEADQSAREKLAAAIKDTSDRIAGAGVDTSEADNLHKSRKAGEEVKKLLVRNLSSDGQTVNVDGFLRGAKNLRAISKYGDRLEQFYGKEGADALMQSLEDAQKLGAKAVTVQKIAKVIGGSLASGVAGGEVVRHVLP